jgi:hypothetical protein
MDFSELPSRFSPRGRHIFDHWQDEKLSRITVANTPENLLRVNKIFSFHSSFMQNIIDFRQNNFEIDIVTQPFLANDSSALPEQTAAQAESLFRQFLALLQAARDWDMDFIDFTKFQILPGAILRCGWDLQDQKFPEAAAFVPILKRTGICVSWTRVIFWNCEKTPVPRPRTMHPEAIYIAAMISPPICFMPIL